MVAVSWSCLINWAWMCLTTLCVIACAVRKENRCMKHYFVETIKHPNRECEHKHVLLARCEGHCSKSLTMPRVSFKPVLHHPFKYACDCCKDRLSVMKAVKLRCKDKEKTPFVYATYRYIVKCACLPCR